MRRRPGRQALIALLVALSSAWAEETVVEVIAVRNRPAEDLVGVLVPLAGPDGVVTAAGGRLVVKATPSALAQIKQVLNGLDVPPRALWITVKQSADRSAATTTAQASGSVTAGGRTRTVVTGAFARGAAQESGANTERLQVLEGSRAFIRTGRAVPVTRAQVAPAGGAPAVVGTAYQEADTGFYVVPRVAGERVTLEISATADKLDDRGEVDFQRVETTVSGRLGEWLSVGAITRRRQGRSSGILSEDSARSAEERTVLLKVEEAP